MYIRVFIHNVYLTNIFKSLNTDTINSTDYVDELFAEEMNIHIFSFPKQFSPRINEATIIENLDVPYLRDLCK